MAATIATDSSILSIAEDLVTERSVCVKVLLISLYLVHLSVGLGLVIIYGINYSQRQMELWVTLGFLVIGLVITSVVNLVGYSLSQQRRRKPRADGIEIERKGEDLAGEAAARWEPLRMLCSVLPLCPVIRYIECLYDSNELMQLETTMLGPSHLRRNGSTRSAGTNEDMRSVRSGATGIEETGLLAENVQRKIRRARRAFRRTEQGAARIGLLQAVVTAGPMAVIQLCFLAFRDQQALNINTPKMEAEVVATCIGTCIVWLSAALTQFYPARRVTLDPEGEVSSSIKWLGQLLIFLWHLVMLSVRILTVALFASSFTYWVVAPIAVHCALIMIAMVLYRNSGIAAATAVNAGNVDRHQRMERIFFDIFYAYVMFFDFVNANQKGKTRVRYLLYYLLVYVENLLLIVAWYCYVPTSMVWYRMTALLAVCFLFFLGFLFMQLYYMCFHPNAEGLTVIGALKQLLKMSSGSKSVPRDPIIGEGQPQQPYWLGRDDVFGLPSPTAPPPYDPPTQHQPSALSLKKSTTEPIEEKPEIPPKPKPKPRVTISTESTF